MKLFPALLGTLLLLCGTTSVALAADDVVFLKSGGRMRGTVIEQTPDGTVHIKLRNGEVRTVAPADVDKVIYGDDPAAAPGAPAAPAAPGAPATPAVTPTVVSAEKGKITVNADSPASVSVSGNDVGRVSPGKPLVFELPAGRHRVVAEFDDGSSDSASIKVIPGLETSIELETWVTPTVLAREGAHFAGRIEVEGLGMFDSGGTHGPVFRIVLGSEIGLNRLMTLRPFGSISYLPAHAETPYYFGSSEDCEFDENCEGLTFIDEEWNHQVLLHLGAELRFHFGDYYSFGVGFAGGGGITADHRRRDELCRNDDCSSFEFDEEEAPVPAYSFGPFITPFALRFDAFEFGGLFGVEPAHGGYSDSSPTVHGGGFIGFVAP